MAQTILRLDSVPKSSPYDDPIAASADEPELAIVDATQVIHRETSAQEASGESERESAELDDPDEDELLEMLNVIDQLNKDKESLEVELEHKSSELAKVIESEQHLKNELDQMQSDHDLVHSVFEVEKSDILKSHEAEKSQLLLDHQVDKRQLEEAHQGLIQGQQDWHEEEKSTLQKSHEEECSVLQATIQRDKEALRNLEAEKSQMSEMMDGERGRMTKNIADALAKLENAELATASAKRDYQAFLEGIREVGKHACRQAKEERPGFQQKKQTTWLRSLGLRTTPKASHTKSTIWDALNADAVAQKLTERFDQLITSEIDLHDRNESLQAEISSLSHQVKGLQEEANGAIELQENLRRQEKRLSEATKDYDGRIQDLQSEHEAAINDVYNDKWDLEKQVQNITEIADNRKAKSERQRSQLRNLNLKLRMLKREKKQRLEREHESRRASPTYSEQNSHENDQEWESTDDVEEDVASSRGRECHFVFLCIDRSMSDSLNSTVNELVNTMFEKLEEESEDGTDVRVAIIGHGDHDVINKWTSAGSISSARVVFGALDLGCASRPSWNDGMELFEKLQQSAVDESPNAKMHAYLIGDGWTGEGSWDEGDRAHNIYERLRSDISIWIFCLGDHSGSDTGCCFKFGGYLSARGCHDHAQDFDPNCVLPSA